MECGRLKEAVKRIELSDAARARIVQNCQSAGAYKTEKKTLHTALVRFKRPLAVAVALSFCLCFAAAAAAGRFGFFKDIKNWNGAVVGMQYEQASEEIAVEATPGEGGLIVTAVLLYPDKPPYSAEESLGIDSYRIADMSGNIVMEGGRTAFFEIAGGKAEILLPLHDIPGGEYKLMIDAFVGRKKADQDLVIRGTWECVFSL